MLQYPHLSPVALALGPIKIHWYGLMYLIGFASAWGLATWRAKHTQNSWTSDQISDLVFYSAVGVLLGGRIGYVLFYDLATFMQSPLMIFKVWEGGMSFHGGLIGVLIAFGLFARKVHRTFFEVADFVSPVVPIGLGAGRLGNFINGELWGRVTTMPWGMAYPQDNLVARHPSPLYQFFFEGIVLFIILWLYSAKPRPRMAVSGMFLTCYGAFRFFTEFFREPDPQVGFVAFHWMTEGQLLSIPMIIIGVGMLIVAYRYNHDSVRGA